MRRFAALFTVLDETTKTNAKVAALADYFRQAPPADAAWAIYFLSGRRLKRLVPNALLRQWAAESAGLPTWLFEESYSAVGDLAETMSLIVPPGDQIDDQPLAHWIENRLAVLAKLDVQQQRAAMQQIWRQCSGAERFVVMKLVTGAFRVGVSAGLVVRGLANATSIPADVITHRLMGDWKPSADFYLSVIHPDDQDAAISRPYPFCLAHPIDTSVGPQSLGEPEDFLIEWKWDGIRGQLIRRSGETFIWSRGEELMEDRWPEIEDAAIGLPDGVVLDGEILGYSSSGSVLPFAELQRRINRKTVGKKLLSEVPVVFQAFDLLEHQGEDIRQLSTLMRRQKLERVVEAVGHPALMITHLHAGKNWEDLAAIRDQSRKQSSEGLMLKHRQSAYSVGRTRGVWWKWKIDPMTIDAVLIYAQAGHGKRASLYTDYTFAVWDAGELVPVAKAYSGLDDAEIRMVDSFVKQNTRERFGPVRSVNPELVMEIAFEGIQESSRHKSGIAVRFPRILRIRSDKRAEDADHLSDIRAMLRTGTK
ncbi:MAG TPA: ATP-dependent DNA ligase [Planctomycetaceae bacterium]|nr:ATP-dependent DNA ligase [Planctomycetaceae bacterium]